MSNLWSSAGSSRDFEAKNLGRFDEPGIVSERAAAIDASLDRGKFLVRLRRIHMFHPSGGASNRPSCQQGFLFRRSAVPAVETAPPPLFGLSNEIRPQGISFHVPADRQKVIVILDWKGFETPLIEVPQAGRLAVSMPALSVR